MSDEVGIPTGAGELEGSLSLPPGPRGIVLFAHGSGSSRHSPRNRHVAEVLEQASLGTLLVDLLTSPEEQVDLNTREHRFDIDLLAGRLVEIAEWLGGRPGTAGLEIGLFGASTGGGAALVCAARRPELIGAVVSRGGRPDLAGEALPQVHAPTLLIVGGLDDIVIKLNRHAAHRLRCPQRVEVVEGASHLFEEAGKLDEVASLARDWFLEHLGA